MNYETIEKWYKIASEELGTFIDDTSVKAYKYLDDLGAFFCKELENEEGVVAYTITKDMLGEGMLAELFMYIKKEHRGSIGKFIKLIRIMEEEAKKNGCKSVAIGSNIGYKDEKVLSFLNRLGYRQDTVRKKIC